MFNNRWFTVNDGFDKNGMRVNEEDKMPKMTFTGLLYQEYAIYTCEGRPGEFFRMGTVPKDIREERGDLMAMTKPANEFTRGYAMPLLRWREAEQHIKKLTNEMIVNGV